MNGKSLRAGIAVWLLVSPKARQFGGRSELCATRMLRPEEFGATTVRLAPPGSVATVSNCTTAAPAWSYCSVAVDICWLATLTVLVAAVLPCVSTQPVRVVETV